MAKGNSDSKVVIDVTLGTDKINSAWKETEKNAAVSGAKTGKAFSDNYIAEAQKAGRSSKSIASGLAAHYRKQGMNSSEAFKRAWSDIGSGGEKAGKKAGKGLSDNISKGVDGATTKLGGLKGALGKIGSLISVAFIGKKLFDFGRQSIELGSDLSEVQNVVSTAFGDMEYKIEAFAQNSVKQFGMSKLAAKKTASTYMAMARGMQMPEEAASDMAIALTGLSGDVASFFNMSQELADTKLKSIFTGETETLKDLGVVMTQTNLKAFAQRKGIEKNIEAMTQAELVSLRYQFVTEQLSLAHGDFAKTQGSWANQTRILSEQWREFMSLIGQALIQILTPALRVLNQMVGVLINWAQAFSNVTAAVFGKQETQAKASAEAIGGIGSASLDAAQGQDKLASSTKKAAKEAKAALAPYDNLNIIQSGGSSENENSSAGAGGISTVIPSGSGKEETYKEPGWLTNAKNTFAEIKKPLENFKATCFKIWGDIKSLGDPLKNWYSTDFKAFGAQLKKTFSDIFWGILDSGNLVLSGLWDTVFFPTLTDITTKLLPMRTQIGTELFSTLSEAFGGVKHLFDDVFGGVAIPALQRLQTIFSDTVDLIYSKWEESGKTTFDNIREAVRNTFSIIDNLYHSLIEPVWNSFMQAVDWLWENHLKPFVDEFLDLVDKIVNGALEIYNKFISPIVNWIVDILAPPIKRFAELVIDLAASAAAIITDMARGIMRSIGGIVDFLVGVFTGDWRRAWQGIKDIFGGIWDSLKGIVKGVLNYIIDFLNYFIRVFTSSINKLISGFNKISVNIPDWVPSIGGKTFGVNIKPIQHYQIPKLAAGAVIPPNREFMAVLGDQKHGRNLEAPESLIRRIVREESGKGDVGGDWHIYIMMPDGTIKGEEIITAAQRLNQRAGRTIIKVEE